MIHFNAPTNVGEPLLTKGWARVRLGEIAEITSGYGFPKKLQGRSEGEIPFFKVMDISKAVLKGETHLKKADNYATVNECRKMKAKPLRGNTVVFAKIGEAIKLNRRAILSQDSLVDNNIMGIHGYKDALDWLYLFFFLMTVRLGDYSRATTVPSVRKTDVEEITIPLAPFAEQLRIVSKIEELFTKLDAGVKSLQTVKVQLRRYRQSVLKSAFEGKLTEEWRRTRRDELEPAFKLLERIKERTIGKHEERRPVDKSNLPELPNDWAWTRLGEIMDLFSGRAFKKSEYVEKGVRLFQIANVSFGKTDWSNLVYVPDDYLAKYPELILQSGDIVMALNRPILARELKISRLEADDVPAILYQRVGKFNLYDGSLRSYLFYYCQSQFFVDRLETSLQGVDQPFVTKPKLLGIVIPIPPLKEQEEIVREIERRFSVIDKVEETVTRSPRQSDKLRQSILKCAFEGELVSQDPNDEPASVLLERIKLLKVQMIQGQEAKKERQDEPKQRRLV